MELFLATRLRRLAAASLLAAAAMPGGAATTVDLADKPLFSTVSVPGNLILALSVEWPTATTPAYPSTTAYSAGSSFLGYFDPEKCYSYTVVNSGTKAAPDYSSSYFAPSGKASSHVCGGSSAWSGNYLNWSSMQTLDAFRWVLTGGYRSVDTESQTILTKTYAGFDSSVMPNKLLDGSSAVRGATPLNWSALATKLRNLGTAMHFTKDDGNLDGSVVDYTGQSANDLKSSTVYRVYVNVKVCDASVGLENNCKAYGRNAKPEGLMQAYASQLRYSAFGYYNHSGTTSQQRDGGVMRARMKYIGPTRTVPGSAALANPASEWNASTGIMVSNPDAADASQTVSRAAVAGWSVGVGNSGVMNYLNKFGYSAKSYKSKDPVSELYYAALRYFKHLGNVGSYTDLSGAGDSATAQSWLDGFPAITDWDDPIVYACQKNFVLGIGDVNTHRDANLYGSTLRAGSSLEPRLPDDVAADRSVNVATATDMVGKLEGAASLGSLYGDSGTSSCADIGSKCNSYYIAGLAYDAHTTDIRSDLAGTQSVNTYWMDVLEGQAYKHKNQYWLAAKYGGFDVPSGFSAYDAGNSTSTIGESAWYNSTDTLARAGAGGTLSFSTDTSKTIDKRPDNYFPGNQPDVMLSGLTKAFAKISSEADASTSTALATASPNVTSSGAVSYSATYDPKTWTGKVIASSVAFAADGTPTLTPMWDARALLDASTVTASTRKIVTCCTASGSAPGLPFTDASLRKAALNERTYYASFASVPGVAAGSQSAADYVAYLRGDTSNELGATGGKYRARAYRLGDVVNAKPVAVGPPSRAYYDLSNPGYSSFKSANARRKTVVYAGANDGMLHAFDGSVGTAASGSELFAYIPSFAYGNADTAAGSGLAALGSPSFTHHYFVDGTPGQFDVDLAKTQGSSSTTPDWRTLLIGGLGKGGTGYYAIDVTDPASWSGEAEVAGKLLWEFTDPRMGYSYGEPSVVKTKKYGWVVVLTSGYNNSDGVGYIFFVNPRTGALLEAVATPDGSPSEPLNLSHQTAYVPAYTDMTADAVYAGDLQGHLWRVDLTGTAAYKAPTLIAKLANADGTAQPVTTRPLIEIEPNSSKRYVMVGTGRLMADSDIVSASQQSFYAIVDGRAASGAFYVSTTLPSGVSFPVTRGALNADTSLLTGIGSAPASTMGWYTDLPVSNGIAQRVNIDPIANQGVVSFAGNLPNGQACNPSGTGTQYAVSFATGRTVLIDVNKAAIASTTTTTGLLTDIAIQRVDGKLFLYNGSGGQVLSPPANLSTASGVKQLNWREVPVSD